MFQMKAKLTGNKKSGSEPHAIIDPTSGHLLVTNQEIKNATLAYCVDNLRSREPDPEAKEIVDMKTMVVEEIMKGNAKECLEIDKSDFELVCKKFKSKQTKSYDFLLKSGEKYQEIIFKLCKRMIKEETFPTLFQKTLLNMIWKQKGVAEVLKNNRFIHLKEHYMPRTVEALVVNKMKDDILSKSTVYQVGGQPGHSTDEHIFAIKSLVEMLVMQDRGMIFMLVDLVSFFDRENINDVIATLYELGVDKRALRLWFKLNEHTEIKVKTSSGMTDTAMVGNVIGQGTAGAALVSQLNLDRGLHTYFGGSSDEIYYGGVRCEYFAYQDDIGKPSAGVLEAQAANIKLTHMFQEKGLEAHPDKTCFIVFGSDNFKNKVNEELKSKPLKLGNFLVKQ